MSLTTKNVPLGVTYEKIGTIQRRLAWPLHKDDTLSRSGRPTGLNIYFGLVLNAHPPLSVYDTFVRCLRETRILLITMLNVVRLLIAVYSGGMVDLHIRSVMLACLIPPNTSDPVCTMLREYCQHVVFSLGTGGSAVLNQFRRVQMRPRVSQTRVM